MSPDAVATVTMGKRCGGHHSFRRELLFHLWRLLGETVDSGEGGDKQ
jgi:hypothetical protein